MRRSVPRHPEFDESMQCLLRLIAVVLLALAVPAWAALDPAVVAQLGAEDSDARVEAIRKLAVAQDPRAIEILLALGDEALALVDDGRRAVIVAGGAMVDAATGERLGAAPANLETVVINNRMRGEIGSAIAALKLGSTDRAVRLAAARELQGSDNEDALPIIEAAAQKEGDAEIKAVLELAGAALAIRAGDPAQRIRAAQRLAASTDPQVRQMLATMITRSKDGSYPEPDESVRSVIQASPACRSARSCCWRRSAWPSPTG
jgi:urea transport system permease protein